MQTKGILLIALGDKIFQRMAFNLAASIKYNAPNAHITLLHNADNFSSIDGRYISFVDNFIYVPEEFYFRKGKNAFGLLKTRINSLTPYEETLYIDVDSLCLRDKNPLEFFNIYKNASFGIIHGGLFNPYTSDENTQFWITFKHIKRLFEWVNVTGPANCQSSVMYFKKDETANKLFAAAEEAYYKLEDFTNWDWYKTVPDELCFFVAFYTTGIIPTNIGEHVMLDVSNFSEMSKFLKNEDIGNKIIISFPSAMGRLGRYGERFYNELSLWYAMRLGLPQIHSWIDKGYAKTFSFRTHNQLVRMRFRER